MLTIGYSSWLGLAFCFLSLSVSQAQSTETSGPGQISQTQLSFQVSPALQSYLNQQQTLGRELQTMVQEGTIEQFQAWQQQNSGAFAALRQTALTLALGV